MTRGLDRQTAGPVMSDEDRALLDQLRRHLPGMIQGLELVLRNMRAINSVLDERKEN